MKNLETLNIKELSIDDQRKIDGGFAEILAGLTLGLAIYEAGKAVGEFAYWVSH